MKSGLHPEFNEAKVICACGNVIETKSTKKDHYPATMRWGNGLCIIEKSLFFRR